MNAKYTYILPAVVVVAALGGCKSSPENVHLRPLAVYKNETTENVSVTLADSSRVTLRPKTRIEVSISDTARKVVFDGEAMFDVVPQKDAPFMVLTRNLHITVLGTRFHVDAFASSPGEEVDLLDGKLRITKSYHSSTDNAPEELASGDMVMINRDIDLMEKEKLDSTELANIRKKF